MKSCTSYALAAALALFAGQAPDENYTLTTGKSCGPEGSTSKPDVKTLNRQKNRFQAPTVDDIDTDVSLAAMLAPGEDQNRFDPARAARIVGFVVDAKPGRKETCNCGATDPIDRDTHIEIGLAPDAPKTQRVIVEVTPRLRKLMREKPESVDWRTLTLQSHGDKGIKGKWVEVTGWLFFDAEHTNAAENTSPGTTDNWRATCWEIHPITDITVLDGPPASTPALPPSTLAVLQHAHVLTVRRNKTRRDFIDARNR